MRAFILGFAAVTTLIAATATPASAKHHQNYDNYYDRDG
jgi:hypothetical protein